ncbi:meiotic nuclear division protein 1 homolog [Bolinopsis microptera]|uniref:meiotic nuclear division protein 1 homolog n=1 Tax=Bolinopsis microptera TaxID=2820187 RepID=UPI0030794373
MSKKKGLSVDEKRKRMMEVFYEKKDVFQLKELEKICPKEKGITPMSVKDILQSLVDDDMVCAEKIGTSNYFWCFPSQAVLSRKRKLEEINTEVEGLKKRKANNGAAIEEAKKLRVEGAERSELLEEIGVKEKMLAAVTNEVLKYKECDPEVLEQKKKEILTSKESINRWTDNIFSVQSWCKNKFSIETKTMCKNFGIPEELDYVE